MNHEIKIETFSNSDTDEIVELEGINALFRLLNIEMDMQVDCFNYKGTKYRLNLRQDVISQNLYKFLSSSIPKSIAKRISKEEKNQDLNRACRIDPDLDQIPICKERPNTAAGRIFGAISEELHSDYKPKSSRLDLPSGCICREEIRRIEKEFAVKQEEIYALKKIIK